MFHPPNLPGMRNPNGNGCQNAGRPAQNCANQNNMALTDNARRADAMNSEEYASSNDSESGMETAEPSGDFPERAEAGLVGPMGPRGASGPPGCPGERGETGPQGVTGLSDRWVQEENPARAGRRGRRVIRKTAYLHHSQGKNSLCRKEAVFRLKWKYRISPIIFL